jgi:antitoxin (DNA-binding transcriptional repressor) of toxin-antitoxin stability system
MLYLMSEHAYELHGDDPGAVERLAQAAGHGEVIYLTRAGQPIAAVVPAALAAALEDAAAAEDADDVAAADEAMDAVEAGEPAIPAEELWAELGLDSASPR